MTKLTKWNVLDYLKTEEDRALYLQASLEEAGDDEQFMQAVRVDIEQARKLYPNN